ncbi:aminopeptidase N-like [Oppia nitens]|uniref:aminopeptidase N-like n=1 Tax=Oppia nitens TaxID=1686743 RepID=UPI0023DA4B21|nr:aminopeptidase N-like [Oppia nitens]
MSVTNKFDMDVTVTEHNHRNAYPIGHDNQHMNSTNKGFFIKTWVIFILLFIAITCIAGIAVFVGLFNPFQSCVCDNSTSLLSKCMNNQTNADNRCLSSLSRDCITDQTKVASLYASTNRQSVRLPKSIVPTHYEVQLQTYIGPQDFYFDGNVTIWLECRQSTDNITVHINDIVIYNESVYLLDDRKQQLPYISHFSHETKRQFFIIHLNTYLKHGKQYILQIKFKGNLNDDLSGFYRSSYKDSAGNKRWLAVTQFQPTDARRAFPCFDEPSMKATFAITLIHLHNYISISNMPKVNTEIRGEWVADTFAATVKMSTYLLAFLVSDFQSISHENGNFRVWSRVNAIETANYSLKVGPKLLKYYEDYFNISYPLPKMDMVAVPDLNAGAMENWGLIIYRETAMLYDETVSSSHNLQRVATVVAHELAHQWFGNLVTPKWWDDLWLNEGFASFMEYEGVDAVYPKWQMFQQFVVDEIQDVFELDCLTTSHPISVPVHNPDEINEIFDRISYGKGASIIRMMAYFLNRDTFRKGVSNYLNAWRYDNAVQDDLWNYLTLAVNNSLNVKKVMDSWTLQDGYPVVTLTRDYDNRKAWLTQKRFLLDVNNNQNNGSIDPSKYWWEIPITYTNQRNANWDPITKLWMTRSSAKHSKVFAIKDEDIPKNDEWIIANLQEVGYYRVNYDKTNWELITKQLMSDHNKIHVINRAQLIDDALDLSRAHLLDYHIGLNITQYLVNEKEFIAWESALNAFSFMDRMLRRSAAYGLWKAYILKIISNLYKEITWTVTEDSENILEKYLQISVIGWSCKYGYPHCTQQSMQLFNQWREYVENKQFKNPIHPNLRSIVYCTAIENGSEEDWNFLWNQFLNVSVASEKDKLLRSLACSREPWLLSRFMWRAFNGSSGIRKQDASYVFRSVATSNYGRDIAYNYLRDQWHHIVKYFGKSFFSFGSLVKSVTSSLNTDFDLKQLQEFYNSVKDNVGTAQRSFLQAIEQTKANVHWMQSHYQQIDNWLIKHNT